jgi:hypothetical protein
MRVLLIAAALLVIAAPALADGPCSWGSTHTVAAPVSTPVASTTAPVPQTPPPSSQPSG